MEGIGSIPETFTSQSTLTLIRFLHLSHPIQSCPSSAPSHPLQGIEVPPRSKTSFDSNVITPGTEFMAKLAFNLRFYCQHRQSTDPGWKDVRVVYSYNFSFNSFSDCFLIILTFLFWTFADSSDFLGRELSRRR
jgi:hypothetical protein